MPNYITHSVMGEVTPIPNDKIKIDKNLLRIFSLGQDLMLTRKGAMDITHNTKTSLFFKNLIDYIVKNNLCEDEEALSYLYGHIMHYELDRKTHPYIYYMTNDIPKKGIVNFHIAFEEYLGDFVLQNKLKLSRSDFVNRCKNADICISESLADLIDDVYLSTYGYYFASNTTEKTLKVLKILNKFRNGLDIINKDAYFNLIGLNKYLDSYSLNKSDTANLENNSWEDPISRTVHTSSFIDIFDDAVSSSQEKMEMADKVIYGKKTISTLDTAFDNSSYDTNLNCDMGKPFWNSRYKILCKKK